LRISTVAFKMPTEQKYFSLFFFCLLRTVLFEVTFTLGFKDKDKKKSQHSINQVFLFLIDDGRIKIRTNNDGSGWPKNLQIREAQKFTNPGGPKTYESGRPKNLRNPGGLKTYGSGSITLNKTALFQNPLDEGPLRLDPFLNVVPSAQIQSPLLDLYQFI
jgi:hypothetical protein